jgi:hypothetical protein
MRKIVRARAGAGIFDKLEPELELEKNGLAPQHCRYQREKSCFGPTMANHAPFYRELSKLALYTPRNANFAVLKNAIVYICCRSRKRQVANIGNSDTGHPNMSRSQNSFCDTTRGKSQLEFES